MRDLGELFEEAPSEDSYPEYHAKVKNIMDLNTIRTKVCMLCCVFLFFNTTNPSYVFVCLLKVQRRPRYCCSRLTNEKTSMLEMQTCFLPKECYRPVSCFYYMLGAMQLSLLAAHTKRCNQETRVLYEFILPCGSRDPYPCAVGECVFVFLYFLIIRFFCGVRPLP